LAKNSETGDLAILRRLWQYAEKVLKISESLSLITDERKLPQIPTSLVVKSVLTMFLARLGSLNSLEQLAESRIWRRILNGKKPCSADTLGRVFGCISSDTIRAVIHQQYTLLKRNKVLEPPQHGLIALVLDGHESHATYRRKCSGCLKRVLNEQEQEQYYHRHVTAQIVCRQWSMLLDIEPQLSGETELSAALRLYRRVIDNYPRAFDVVTADALYCNAPFVNTIIDSGKDIVIVLKDDRRHLFKDAEFAIGNRPFDCKLDDGRTHKECWDVPGLVFNGVKQKVRVVSSKQTTTIRRQLHNGAPMQERTCWKWVTSLSPIRANTQTIVQIGHSRWNIENQGFNEMVNHWHSDHIYKHASNAILNFWLMCMLAYNLFHCFFLRSLKAILRCRYTMLHIARMLQSELYAKLNSFHPP
jgi:Transposase DDE domain